MQRLVELCVGGEVTFLLASGLALEATVAVGWELLAALRISEEVDQELVMESEPLEKCLLSEGDLAVRLLVVALVCAERCHC